MPDKDINQAFADFLLRHAHYVSRFENGTVAALLEHYARAKPAVVELIRRLELTGASPLSFRMRRLQELLAEINGVLNNANEGAIRELSRKLSDFAASEAATQGAMLGGAFGAIGVDLASIPLQSVEAMIYSPLGGATFAERMRKRYVDAIWGIKQELTQALIMGEGMDQAGARLFGLAGDPKLKGSVGARLREQSDVIARTEIMRVSNEVAKATYDANSDVLRGVQFLATLDPRTCLVCGEKDGTVFTYGKNDAGPGDTPPLHPNCRCKLVPVAKTWDELGLVGKAPKRREPGRPFKYVGERPPKGFGDVFKYADRETWGGFAPGKTTYQDWLTRMDREDPAFVRDVLGRGRYDLWSRGKLRLGQMVAGDRVLPLEELNR